MLLIYLMSLSLNALINVTEIEIPASQILVKVKMIKKSI